METINTITSAATNAIWGGKNEQNTTEEPISGVQGNTDKGEPYDAGNKEENFDGEVEGEGNYTTSSKPSAGNADTVPKTENRTPEVTTGAGISTAPTSSEPVSAPTDDTTGGSSTAQSAGNPQADPAIESKKASETAKDPTTGPDPAPVDEAAAKNEGNAGSANSSPGGGAAVPGMDGSGVEKESHGEGTGEKYVKSTGLKAEGGNFDAAAPGAGREADRLLEEKGVHRDDPNHASTTDDAEVDTGRGESPSGGKTSLKDKIKAKLHKH